MPVISSIREIRKLTLIGMAVLGLLMVAVAVCVPVHQTLGLSRHVALAGGAYGSLLLVLAIGLLQVLLPARSEPEAKPERVAIDPTPAPVSVDFQICVDQLVATVASMDAARSAHLYASVGGDPAWLANLPPKVRLEEICVAVVTYARTFGDVSERLKAMLDFLDGASDEAS